MDSKQDDPVEDELNRINALAFHVAQKYGAHCRTLTADDYRSAGLEAWWVHRDSQWLWAEIYRAMIREWALWVSGKPRVGYDRRPKLDVVRINDWDSWDKITEPESSTEDVVINRELIEKLRARVDENRMAVWKALVGFAYGTRSYATEIRRLGFTSNKHTKLRTSLKQLATSVIGDDVAWVCVRDGRGGHNKR